VVLIVMSMVLMTNQVSATPKTVIGAGVASCGAWLEARRSPSLHAVAVGKESWVLGYVSGVNADQQWSDDFLAAADAPALFAWLDSYCPQHPLDPLYAATNALIHDLSMRALVAGTKPK
jgi:hypothetical protein